MGTNRRPRATKRRRVQRPVQRSTPGRVVEPGASDPVTEGSAEGSGDGALYTMSRHDSPTPEVVPCGRDQRGRFTRANTEQRTHGAYSLHRWQELAAVIVERRTALVTSKGFTSDDVPPSLSIIVDALIEADVMRSSFFAYITATGGPLSVKGRTRRAVEGWSRACDRCAKLAGMIGLQREPKAETVDDWFTRADDDRGDEHERDEPQRDETNGGSDEQQHSATSDSGDNDQ